MKYYKIIKDDAFIGIASSNDFVRNQQKHQYLENVDESLAQFLSHDGILYRTTWMQPLPQKVYIYTEANVEEISEQLYNELAAAIAANEEIEVDPNPPIIDPPTPEIEQDDALLLEYVRNAKIKELSYTCNQKIEAGIDYNGSHYSLSQYDQINLLNAQIAILNGAETVVYHADGEVYRDYTAEEINAIATAAEAHKEATLAHYNQLKTYIKTLSTISEISAITWSDDNE